MRFTTIFPGPRANAGLVPKIHCYTAYLCVPPTINFRPNAALQTQNSAQMFSFFPVLHAAKTHSPNVLPSHRPIITRNERKQPENLQSSKFVSPPPVQIIHVVPLNTPQIILLCLVFSLLKVNYDLIRYISITD